MRYNVSYLYYLTYLLFLSDYTIHNLDRQSILKTRANLPFKNSHFPYFDSLTDNPTSI